MHDRMLRCPGSTDDGSDGCHPPPLRRACNRACTRPGCLPPCRQQGSLEECAFRPPFAVKVVCSLGLRARRAAVRDDIGGPTTGAVQYTRTPKSSWPAQAARAAVGRVAGHACTTYGRAASLSCTRAHASTETPVCSGNDAATDSALRRTRPWRVRPNMALGALGPQYGTASRGLAARGPPPTSPARRIRASCGLCLPVDSRQQRHLARGKHIDTRIATACATVAWPRLAGRCNTLESTAQRSWVRGMSLTRGARVEQRAAPPRSRHGMRCAPPHG